MSVTGHQDGWFVRTAGRVGDLGSPFYAEERQRDVWNEASAVGFQLLLWLLPLVAVVLAWVVGAPAVPYAAGAFAAAGAASWVVLLYARSRGVDMSSAEGVRALRLRTVVFLGLLVAFLLGVLRAVPDGSFGSGLAWGLLGGGLLGILVISAGRLRARRSASRAPGVTGGGTSS